MENIELSYKPLTKKITEEEFNLYLIQPGYAKIAREIAITPLDEAMKKQKKEEFIFKEFKVTRSLQKRTSVVWESVYNGLLKFLEIRADDSRAASLPDLKYFEGIGYCILIPTLKEFIEKEKKEATSKIEYPQLFWPRRKKGEYVRELMMPDRNYSVVNQENASIVLQAKKFCSSLEEEVETIFKEANLEWFEKETGYSKKKLPKPEESPLKRTRKIAKGKYIFIGLVREEAPEYQKIIETLKNEMDAIEETGLTKDYKIKVEETKEKALAYINIKNVYERLSLERLKKDRLVKIEGRYELAP